MGSAFLAEPAVSKEVEAGSQACLEKSTRSGLAGAWGGGVRSMDLLPVSAGCGPKVKRFGGRRPECANLRILEA